MKTSSRLFFILTMIILLAFQRSYGYQSQRPINPDPKPPVTLDLVLFEDFESPSGWKGGNPPTGWTVIDGGIADGTWDTYDWAKYSAWGGSTARVSGGSQNRYNYDWLISPSANFTTASACTLFYRHYYDDYVTQNADSALVMLSNDGGSTWGDTVVIYSGSDYGSDSVPDSEYFDISSFVSGYNSVKVAFQYVKRQAVLVGAWRIDDVRFRADGTSILTQDFESSWGPNGDNPPSGWSIEDINVVKWDDNDWHQADLTGWGNIADIYWSPVEQQNELLTSNVMDFSDGTNDIYVTLKQWYDDQPDDRDTAFILGSKDAGATWAETLAVYRGSDHGSFVSPAYDSLNILSWANNESQVEIGFKYVGNNDGKWYIDSVRVERVDMLASDVAVTSIDNPPSNTILGYAWPLSAQVENVGLNTNTFDVVMRIADSTGAIVYADTQTVMNLPSTGQTTVNFYGWVPYEINTHSLKCFAKLISDMDRSNDTATATTYTYNHIGNGGPVEGWSFADNITGNSGGFNWMDIRSLGTAISFSDPSDGNSGMIDMGMNFDYFGETYSRVAVAVDGWLSFEDSTSSDNSNSPIPDPDGPSAMVALLWADLHLRDGQVYYYHDTANNIFVIQYDSVEFNSVAGSYIGMEAILNGSDNTIKMLYSYLEGGVQSDVSVGIENQAEDLGLAYDNNGQFGQTPLPGLAITYTYLPPHDVRPWSLISPVALVQDNGLYNIVVAFRNVGANTESFSVTATDNFGYSNTQAVIDLLTLSTTNITFPGWGISNACTSYTLTLVSSLSGDLNPANDTLQIVFESSGEANLPLIYDSGEVLLGLTTDDPTDIIASKFNSPYQGAVISAVAYKFLNGDEFENYTGGDTALASIYIDSDNNDIPDPDPLITTLLPIAKNGWTIWNIGCDTALIFDCANIWVGWSIRDSLSSASIAVDAVADYPDQKWVRTGGLWQILPGFRGDYMIRVFLDADLASAPGVSIGNSQLSGAAPPDGIDTVSTTIQNTGTGCDLKYKVRVLQTAQRTLQSGLNGINGSTPFARDKILSLNHKIESKKSGKTQIEKPHNPPQILGSGGPDNFGYVWADSDDPDGPTFSWAEISALGTEVTWDFGNSDDGYTNLIPMGMTFNYYGINYERIVISSNGWVSFTEASDAFTENQPLPMFDELNNVLAVDWDDLDGGTIGHCYYYHDIAANAFIISWIDWSHYPSPNSQHNFQVILDGTSGTILYQYSTGTYQSDISIGIENEDGSDGLQVAYNQAYLHNNLAVLFAPPIFWLSTDLPNGTLPPSSIPESFNVLMNATGLHAGIYNGAIIIQSNDPVQPTNVINVEFQIEGICAYVPGDVNGSGAANGIDVSFMVNFFRGGSEPHDECPPCAALGSNMNYPQGDVNASCGWNGIDVTYFVNFLKGIGPALRFCDLCPPAGRVARSNIGELTPVLSAPLKTHGGAIAR
jgi:hypothetical protein